MKDEWIQTEIEHCPKKECRGMLLTNPLRYGRKCTDCGKLFMCIVTYEEVLG